MLKKRIVATLLVNDGVVVQSLGFKRYLPVGRPSVAVEFLNLWGVDEIILVDINATRDGKCPDYAMVRGAATHCRVPLTVGGGITHIDHISELMNCGADKVALNQAALYRPELLTAASHIFGDQCVVASIDSVMVNDSYKVWDYSQQRYLSVVPAALAAKLQHLGAGEILINSVDRDGSYLGYDHKLIAEVCEAVTIPVICSGGAGRAQHFVEVFQSTPVSAAAAANFFHFTEHSVTTVKALVSKSIPIRNDAYFHYTGCRFDDKGRLLKKEDFELDNMLFERIAKEVI